MNYRNDQIRVKVRQDVMRTLVTLRLININSALSQLQVSSGRAGTYGRGKERIR